MKLLPLTALLLAAYLCHRAEKKSRKWYDDRLLLRIQGAFVASAIWVALY